MLIVIEGPDRTGKSTLAKQLYSDVKHFGPPKRHPLVEYSEPILKYRQFDRPFVADRFHLGEMVYGPMFRGKSGLTDGEFEWLELLLQSRGGVTVLCTGNEELTYQRVTSDGDDMFDLDEDAIANLQWDFAQLIYKLRTRVFRHRFDYNKSVNTELVRKTAVQLARNTETLNSMHPSYIGSPHPEVVYLLPDTPRDEIAAYPRGSLTQAGRLLEATRHLNYRYGLFNPISNQKVYSLWMRLGGPHLITVGTTTKEIRGVDHIPAIGHVPMITEDDDPLVYAHNLQLATDERFVR